jgi:hypothetical protein
MNALRPADFARLRLAASGAPPRPRARDQQADLAGLALERKILNLLAALDPDAEEIDSALASIIASLGEPTGPARSLCSLIRDDWLACQDAPHACPWLVSEALTGAEPSPRRRRRQAEDAEDAS